MHESSSLPPHTETGIVLAVDLGKTRCRVRLTTAGTELAIGSGRGAPGLAAVDGVERAWSSIDTALASIGHHQLGALSAVCVGAAGATAHPEGARALGTRLARRHGVPTVVVSDVLSAHLGALGGGPGTVLVVGTGSVAWFVGPDGSTARAGGWGASLGDEGGGRWVGQQGLAGVLRDHDGRDPATTLTVAAQAFADPVSGLPCWVEGSGDPVRTLAGFAPTVLQHAEAGDPVSMGIVDRAVQELTRTTVAAADPEHPVCVIGGLTDDPCFRRKLTESLTASDLLVLPPLADAVTGVALLALPGTLPHERHTHRVRP